MPAYALAPLTIGIGTFSYHALSFDDMMAQLEILLPTNGLHNQQIEMSRGEYMVMSHPSDELFRTAKAKLETSDYLGFLRSTAAKAIFEKYGFRFLLNPTT